MENYRLPVTKLLLLLARSILNNYLIKVNVYTQFFSKITLNDMIIR